MGLGRQRVWSWEGEGRFPGRAKLASFYARLERVRAEGIAPMRLAEWVELGPDDKAPFDDEPPPPARPGGEEGAREAEITRFADLVESIDQLGRLAQARAIDAATSGEKIPEQYQELVRVALDVRELSLRNPALQDARAATGQSDPARTDSSPAAAAA